VEANAFVCIRFKRPEENIKIVLFSVIIPTYNRAHLLPEALESVWRQAFSDYEVIVVDDGSTDGTADYLRSLHKRVTVISQLNLGPGAARNLGAAHAKGHYLAFLDSDDLWFPWTLYCFAELIRLYDRPAVLGATFVEFSKEEELVGLRQTDLKASAYVDYFASHGHDHHIGAGMSVLAREKFIQTGGFAVRRMNAEDHDLILRMGDARGFVQLTSPVTLGCRRHGQNATTNLHHTVEGVFFLIQQERKGVYPGGTSRALARREYITLHTRPVSIGCIQQDLWQEGWELYRATFRWHIVLGRIRYLAAFPLVAALARFRWSKTLSLLLSSARSRSNVSANSWTRIW
jgi:Glycosyl transferase family 2